MRFLGGSFRRALVVLFFDMELRANLDPVSQDSSSGKLSPRLDRNLAE
jgi:hypothetical protein